MDWGDVAAIGAVLMSAGGLINSWRTTTFTRDASREKADLDEDNLVISSLKDLAKIHRDEIRSIHEDYQGKITRLHEDYQGRITRLQEDQKTRDTQHAEALVNRDREMVALQAQVRKHEDTIEQQRQQIEALQQHQQITIVEQRQ